MAMDIPLNIFSLEPSNIQTLLDNIDNSSQVDQDDLSLTLFHFNTPTTSVISHHNSTHHATPSTNSNSSTDDATPSNPLAFPCLTLQTVLNAMTNQKISIYLQKLIKEMKQSELDSLLNELKGNFFCLMLDKNGNYLCSDIFKQCTHLQRRNIIYEIYNHISDIAIHEYGTHSIQTLIELTSTQEEANLLCSALCDEYTMQKVALHQRGAYVIQKMVSIIPEDIRINFNLYLLKVVHLLSVDVFGVCTVKQFAMYTKRENTIAQLLNVVYQHFYTIAKNQYGNYLIQFLLKIWWNRNEMFAFKILIERSFYELAIDEYASHVVTKYVRMLNYNEKQRMYTKLLQKGILTLLVNNKHKALITTKILNCFK